MKLRSVFVVLLAILSNILYAQTFVTDKKEPGSFLLASGTQPIAIYTDTHDDWLVHKTAELLQHDIEMVTGKKPDIVSNLSSSPKQLIIIGTVDSCDLIGKLANEKRLNMDSVKGRWEAFTLQTIQTPFKEVQHALVIAGSDKRGAAYGAFELSQQMG